MPIPSTPTRQFALTTIARVAPNELEDLREELARIGQETLSGMRGSPVARPKADFASMATVHYARWVVLDPAEGSHGPHQLVLSTNYDGPSGEPNCAADRAQDFHLDDVLSHARRAIDGVYAHCVGYPGAGASNDEVKAYLRSLEVATPTFYVGARGRSLEQIRYEARLRRSLQDWLDAQRRQGTLPSQADAVRQAAAAYVRAQLGSLPPTFPPQETEWGELIEAVLPPVLLIGITLPISLPILLFGVRRLRHLEKTDAVYEPEYRAGVRAHVAHVAHGENVFLQNQLTHMVEVKDGALRQKLLTRVFWSIDLLARTYFNKGKLGDIPTIHFARWVQVDDKRRVLFFSNFDSSWESYLGDFIDQASNGLTAVWSNTKGYPRTRYLLFAGSRDEGRFKAWARQGQLPTPVWYAAYPDLSIDNINENTEIRRGLADPNSMLASTWLEKLT